MLARPEQGRPLGLRRTRDLLRLLKPLGPPAIPLLAPAPLPHRGAIQLETNWHQFCLGKWLEIPFGFYEMSLSYEIFVIKGILIWNSRWFSSIYAQPPPHFCAMVESAREWTIQESWLSTPELLLKFWKRESLAIQESRVMNHESSIP